MFCERAFTDANQLKDRASPSTDSRFFFYPSSLLPFLFLLPSPVLGLARFFYFAGKRHDYTERLKLDVKSIIDSDVSAARGGAGGGRKKNSVI